MAHFFWNQEFCATLTFAFIYTYIYLYFCSKTISNIFRNIQVYCWNGLALFRHHRHGKWSDLFSLPLTHNKKKKKDKQKKNIILMVESGLFIQPLSSWNIIGIIGCPDVTYNVSYFFSIFFWVTVGINIYMPPISHDSTCMSKGNRKRRRKNTNANYHHHQITTLTVSGILLLFIMTRQLASLPYWCALTEKSSLRWHQKKSGLFRVWKNELYIRHHTVPMPKHTICTRAPMFICYYK